ncbi:hypothetical protein [Nocardia salmonicida]|uniref:hypothetical protein n=1 Tax=Nocardia salmonicida TaxID=53431 RepID=UPI003CEBCB45
MSEQPRRADAASLWSADSMFGASIHDSPIFDGAEAAPEPLGDVVRDPDPIPDRDARDPDTSDSDFATYSTGEAALRGGGIIVTATDSGLPLAVRLTPDQLRRDPDDLGDDILRLCKLAANRAGLLRRSYLAELGVPDSALDLLELPSQRTVEQYELAEEFEHGYEPRSWLDQDGDSW